MSFGQGINIKLYSGQKPWDEQFYSSTCDSLYVGGQHGGSGQTNCPYIEHKNWGLPSANDGTTSIANLRAGNIDTDFFNKWFKARPVDLTQTDGHLTRLGLAEEGIEGGLGAISPGTTSNYWNTYRDTIGEWAQQGNQYFEHGYSGLGSNGWDWALQSCRQEYGAYINPDVKCDDPVCQMEKIAQTNPVYFESACNMDLDNSCVTDTIAKAVLVPIGEALVGIALTVATGGAADAALIGVGVGEAAGEAAADAGVEMAEIASEEGAEGVGETAGEEAGEAGEEAGEETSEQIAKKKAEREADDAARKKAAEENVEKNACENYKDGGIARSGALASKRTNALYYAEKYGVKEGAKARVLGKAGKVASAANARGISGSAVAVAGIAGADYIISGSGSSVFNPAYQNKAFKGGSDIVETSAEAYHDAFSNAYKICIDNLIDDANGTNEKREKDKYGCRSTAMTKAQDIMKKTAPLVADSQAIGTDALLAKQWASLASLSKRAGGLYKIKKYGKLGKRFTEGGNPFAKGLKGGWGGAAKQAVKCNWASLGADAAMTTGAGLLADSIAHEDCYTCQGNQVQKDKSVEYNPFKSGLGIEPEKPYDGSPDDAPIPAWSGDVVKPYCFIPNRRGAEGYCPIFGDTLKFETGYKNANGVYFSGSPSWNVSNSTEYQKYKGAILGTTDFEMPNYRPFWTLNDTQSRVQTGKQGLHTIIEGDTPPDVWNTTAALDPAVEEDPSNVMVTNGGRQWTNYGYVCNYNHTDDFIMNPIQAQNFLDMTVGPINTTDISVSGMMSSTCAEPMLFKDIQGAAGQMPVSKAIPETVYAKTACMVGDVDPIPIEPNDPDRKTFAEYSLEDKIKYYFKSDNIMKRVNVLGQGMFNEHYQTNTIPVPSDPNIPYNQDFRYTDGARKGGDDAFALLPSATPQYTGALPWFQKQTSNYSFSDYQDTFDADNANYKLPATFWYEHDTFNKIMADYCIRKGPRVTHPGEKENYDRETATSSWGNCMLMGGVGSNAPAGLPASPNAVRTYCPNMFLKQAGIPARGPARAGETDSGDLRNTCYNCSLAEMHANVAKDGAIPRPTDVCARWYKGMIDSYKNISNITKQNPTQLFKEYHKAVDEYCNIPSHRDLVECSCHNADNINNPTEYNHYFQTWSSFENASMGTKGMKYCWLTPCVANLGGFSEFEAEDIINFKDPAAYVNAFRQTPDSPWVGKCPDMACEEFLIYTDNTKLTDDHINTGIHACGGDTLSNEGYICSKNPVSGDKECIPSGRYVSNTDPEYSQTQQTCLDKCVVKGPTRPPCIEHYYICKDGELTKTYDKEYSQFWSGLAAPGSDACKNARPKNAPPGTSSAVIDVSDPSEFAIASHKCQTEPYIPSKDIDQEETYKEILLIIIVVMTAFLMIVLVYLFMVRPYLPKKTKTSRTRSSTGTK